MGLRTIKTSMIKVISRYTNGEKEETKSQAKRVMSTVYTVGVLLLITQLVLLLFSPKYHQRSRVLQWYYFKIFKPLFSASNSGNHQWKYYIVPCFYFSLYNYLAFYLFYYKLSTVLSEHRILVKFETQFFIPVMICIPLISGLMCYIKSDKYQQQQQQHFQTEIFPYDNLIFFSENSVCPTCTIQKPARSKHCSICNRCVLYQDHHCVWFNCCIGGTNFQWFYIFLLSNWIILLYGFSRLLFIMFIIPSDIITKIPKKYENSMLSLFILCGCFVIVLSWFIYTQLDLIMQGMTTNESDKWYNIHQLIQEKLLIKSTRSNKYYELYTPGSQEDVLTIPATSLPANNTNDSDTAVLGISLNRNDNTIYNLGTFYEIIETPYQIENIYDKGNFWLNLKERFSSSTS